MKGNGDQKLKIILINVFIDRQNIQIYNIKIKKLKMSMPQRVQ